MKMEGRQRFLALMRTLKSSSFLQDRRNPSNTKVCPYPLIGPDFLTPIDPGTTKYEPLTRFLKSILDGTADLKIPNENVDSDRRDEL